MSRKPSKGRPAGPSTPAYPPMDREWARRRIDEMFNAEKDPPTAFERNCAEALGRIHYSLGPIPEIVPWDDEAQASRDGAADDSQKSPELIAAEARLRDCLVKLKPAPEMRSEPSDFERQLLTLLRRIDRCMAVAFPIKRKKS